eukprot:4446978-Prymnesium_polylepis.1
MGERARPVGIWMAGRSNWEGRTAAGAGPHPHASRTTPSPNSRLRVRARRCAVARQLARALLHPAAPRGRQET